MMGAPIVGLLLAFLPPSVAGSGGIVQLSYVLLGALALDFLVIFLLEKGAFKVIIPTSPRLHDVTFRLSWGIVGCVSLLTSMVFFMASGDGLFPSWSLRTPDWPFVVAGFLGVLGFLMMLIGGYGWSLGMKQLPSRKNPQRS